jgi:hypothetical protein
MAVQASFSVVVNNYNYGRFLQRALDSALEQDYPAELVEVVVVDDGSTDDSREVLQRYADNPRVKVRLQENRGQASAIAAGVELATRDYVCLLDSDDLFRPDKLKVLDRRIGELGGGELFLCHDLELYDSERGTPYRQSWFQYAQLAGLKSLRLPEMKVVYPYSVPVGQVYSRALLLDVVEAIPTADWPTGADNPIAQGAALRTGIVHYASEVLGRYSIHGSNRLIAFDAKQRLAARPETQRRLLERRPRLLWFLERYLDTLALDVDARQERVAQIKRLNATLPVSSTFAVPVPERLTFVVAAVGGEAQLLNATLEAVAKQTHPNCEVLVAACDASLGATYDSFARAHPGLRWQLLGGEAGRVDGDRQRALLLALKQASGRFVAPIACGDRPDRDFAERHVYMHRYLTASMVSACDYRLQDEGYPLQEGGYGRRKLWESRRRVAAFRRPAGNHWWLFSPRSGNAIRRTPMIELFLDHALAHGVPQGTPAEWLLLHYAAALGGCMQFGECLTTLRFDVPGDQGGMHARDPGDARFVPRLAQPQSAAFYFELLSAHLAQFRAHFGPQLRLFARWALTVDAPDPAALRKALDREKLHPEVAALI